jgi:hypothetical protein
LVSMVCATGSTTYCTSAQYGTCGTPLMLSVA